VTVRILEPSSSGHRLYYVRVLAEGCTSPLEWVTTAAAVASQEANVHLRHLLASGQLTVRVLEPWPGKARALRTAAMDASDVVVVPDGDRSLPAAVVLALVSLIARGPRPAYRFLLMRPELGNTVPVRGRNRWRRKMKRLLLQVISVLGGKQPSVRIFGLVDAFGYDAALLLDGVIAVPDPVVARSAAPSPPRAGRLVVGLLGAVDLRKNPDLLASACRDVFRGIEGQLVVVGRVSADALTALTSVGLTKTQLVVENRYVDEEELVVAAAACDVIALLYANHDSSSGVLALAAQVGVPVLVPSRSRLASTAGRGGFGLPAELTVAGVSSALRRIAEEGPELRAAAAKAGRLLGTREFVEKLAGP
jgi:glycosyltransferase involved in cell wall biosynthesis